MKRDEPVPTPAGYDWTWEQNRQRQRREGLALSPAERLEWLERMVEEWLPLVGAARRARLSHDRKP